MNFLRERLVVIEIIELNWIELPRRLQVMKTEEILLITWTYFYNLVIFSSLFSHFLRGQLWVVSSSLVASSSFSSYSEACHELPKSSLVNQ